MFLYAYQQITREDSPISNVVIDLSNNSGGGACVVLSCCSASGTIFQVSGTKQISVVRNGSFYNVDRGIEPDIYISRPEDFYNRPALVERLHNGW